MKKEVNIIDIKWKRGNRSLKVLKMIVLFNQRKIKLNIKNKKDISKIIKFHFFDMDPKERAILKQDFKRELRFNKKECKKTLKINKKAKKIIMNSTYLLH